MICLQWKKVLLGFVLLDIVCRQTYADNCKHEFSSRFGKITYEVGYPGEKCDWIFTFNASSSDVVLGIKFTNNFYLTSEESVTLPDKTILTHGWINQYCGVFMKYLGGQKDSCHEGVKYPIICDKPAVYSKSWPPRITTDVYYLKMELVYGFFDCTNITTTTTTTATTKATTTTTATTTPTTTATEARKTTKPSTAPTTVTATTKTGVEPTTTAVSTGLLSSEVTTSDTSQGNNPKLAAQEAVVRNMTVASGVLPALLLIAVCVLVATIFKYRKLRSQMLASNQPTANGNNPSVNNVNNVYTMATAPSQSTYSVAYGAREMVDNELYTTSNVVGGEKQTVYNELYTA